MKRFSLILTFSCISLLTFSQSRLSSQSGDWHNSSTWGGLSVPDNSSATFGTVYVLHEVTVRAAVYSPANPLRIDQLIVSSGGNLIVEAGAALRIEDGSGRDLTISSTGQISISGVLFTNLGVSYKGLTSSNCNFQSGAELRAASADIPVAGGYGNITVYLQDVVGSLTLGPSWSQMTSTTNLVVNCPNLGSTMINFGGVITQLNGLEIQDTDGTTGGYLVVNNIGTSTLNVGAGGISISGDSRFFVNYAGNVTINLAGDFLVSPSASALYSQATAYGIGKIVFSGGDFVMNSGIWNMASSGSDGLGNFQFLNGAGMFVTGGQIVETGSGSANGLLEFLGGTGDQNLEISSSAFGEGLLNLVVNKSGGDLVHNNLFLSNLSLLDGAIRNLAAGSTVSVTGDVSVNSGEINATQAISLNIGGSGMFPASLPFSTGSSIQQLTLNRQDLNLNLTGVSLQDGSQIEIRNGQIASAIPALGTYDIIYNNAAPMNSGEEVSIDASRVRNVTKQGSGTLTLVRDITINGNFILESGSGIFSSGDYDINLVGDVTVNQSLIMNSGSTLTFLDRSPLNTHLIGGSEGAISIGNLVVNGALVVERSIDIRNNITISPLSSLVANSGTFNFIESSSIFNSGTAPSFFSVNLNGSLIGPANDFIVINGNFTGDGGFGHNNGTVQFNGSGVSTLSGSNKSFYNLVVGSLATLESNASLLVNGNIVNDGIISFDGGTMSKDGLGTLSGSGSTQLASISINSGATFSTANNFSISGAFVNNGTFTSTGTVTFNGTSTLSGSTNTNFNHIAISTGSSLWPSNLFYAAGDIVNNGSIVCTAGTLAKSGPGTLSGSGTSTFSAINILAGQSLGAVSDFSITGQLVGTGSFTSSATVTFAGNTTMSGSGSKSFNNVIIDGTALTPNANYTLNGNMTVVSGILNAGNRTTTFNGETIITGSAVNFNYLEVGIGASVEFPNGTVTIAGNFSNNGIFVHGNGTVNFTSSGSGKVIGGSNILNFYNLQIDNNASSVDVQNNNASGVTIEGLLTLASGAVLDATGTSNSSWTLLSTSTSSASVGKLLGGASIMGDVEVQQYISPLDDKHRFISMPVSAPVSELQDDLPITGNFSGTSFPCEGCNNNNPSLNWFNESSGGDFSARYAATPEENGDNTALLVPGRGYDIYMWDGLNRSSFDVAGPLNQGTISFLNLTHTPSVPTPDPSTDGWHLLGNPYASTIDWSSSEGWSRSNIDPTVWVWDVAAQIWRSYHLTNGGNLPNGLISSGQGFWVFVYSGGGSMSINENAKSLSNGAYYRVRNPETNGLIISLSQGTASDQAYLLVNDKATLQFDQGLDSYKFSNGAERHSLAIETEDVRRLGYAVVGPNDRVSEIPLSISTREKGQYRLSFERIDDNGIFDDLILWDKFLNKFKDISTSYDFEISNDVRSWEHRFVLVNPGNRSIEVERLVNVFPNPASGQLFVEINSDSVNRVLIIDSFGNSIKEVEIENYEGHSKSSADVGDLPNGIYFIKIFYDGQVQTHKIIKH